MPGLAPQTKESQSFSLFAPFRNGENEKKIRSQTKAK